MWSNGRMRVAVSAGLMALLPFVAHAEVEVKSSNGRLDLRATAAPVSEILDRLAKQTGMKVTYDAPVRQPVTVTLLGRTPAEAVLGVLDGLGLNYALRMDLAGTRVEALMIYGSAAVAAAGAPMPPPTPNAPTVRPTAAPTPEPEEEAEQGDDAEQQPEPPQKPGTPPQPAQPQPAIQAPAPGPGLVGVPRPAGPTFPGPGAPTAGPMFPVSPFAPPAPTAPTLFPGNQAPPEPQAPPQPGANGGDADSQ